MPMNFFFFKIFEGVEEGWVADSAQSFTGVFLANERKIKINCLDNLLLALA